MKHGFYKNLNTTFFVLLAIGSAASIADNYRWINQQGEPVYSDRPPPAGVDVEVVKTQSMPRNTAVEDESAALETDSGANTGSTAPGNPATNPGTTNAALCEQAKMNLLVLDGPDAVNVRNDQGNVVELSSSEREIARRTAQAKIDIYCT